MHRQMPFAPKNLAQGGPHHQYNPSKKIQESSIGVLRRRLIAGNAGTLSIHGWYGRLFISSLLALFFSLAITSTSSAAAVTLAWDPNPSTPERYHVYMRLANQDFDYNTPVWSGTTATCTIDQLSESIYYFVVRSYLGDVESGDSNEVEFKVDIEPPPVDTGTDPEDPGNDMVDDNDAPNDPSTPPVVSPPNDGGSPASIRINTGGKDYIDDNGNLWQADFGFNTGMLSSTNTAIDATGDDFLYQTNRWDPRSGPELEYGFDVANGEYVVNLHFADIWSGTFGVGLRLFDILIEEALVETDLDIFAEVGGNTAVMISYHVTVNDGKLNIRFEHGKENTQINAIEIIAASTDDNASDAVSALIPSMASFPASSSGPALIRLNAGGENYTDVNGNLWQADFGFNSGLLSRTTTGITDTDDDTLYQSSRWDPRSGPELEYRFDVPDGDYEVNLHFADIWSGTFGVGLRLFDILIEGELVEADLDIFAEVGGYAATIIGYDTTVTDGELNIRFEHGVENTQVNAIEVISK